MRPKSFGWEPTHVFNWSPNAVTTRDDHDGQICWEQSGKSAAVGPGRAFGSRGETEQGPRHSVQWNRINWHHLCALVHPERVQWWRCESGPIDAPQSLPRGNPTALKSPSCRYLPPASLSRYMSTKVPSTLPSPVREKGTIILESCKDGKKIKIHNI